MTTSTSAAQAAATAPARRQDRAARVAVEELTGLALQERAYTALLARHAAEAPLGGPRERVEAHLQQSRDHQRTFAEQVAALRAHRGMGELVLGLVRSGAASAGMIGAAVAQVATLPLSLVRRAGGEERLLEDVGVEAAGLALKLVILTAVCRALELSAERDAHEALERVRTEALSSWDALLEQTPELMGSLVAARAHDPSYDFRTAGGPEGRHDLAVSA